MVPAHLKPATENQTSYRHALQKILQECGNKHLAPIIYLFYSSPASEVLLSSMGSLEKTQKLGLRVCLKDWSFDYTDLLSVAKIPTLSSRRFQAKA